MDFTDAIWYKISRYNETLENIEPKLNLRKLLEAITLNIEDSTPIFAIKLACGKSEAIANFRE